MTISAGIYDMPLADYVRDPCPAPSLNAGACHALLTQSPLHAWTNHPRLNPNYQSEESSRLDLGTIAHAILLEGDHSRIVVVDAEDWRTKAAKEQRDEARAVGKLPILIRDMERVATMVSVAAKAIKDSEIAEDWYGGQSEQSMFWEEMGVWWRSRPDRKSKRILFDYKTCQTAEPNAFLRTILSNGYDLQAAIGIRGVYELESAFEARFVFVAQEIDPPYAVSFIGLDNGFLAWVDKKLDHAAKVWSECISHNRWPSYPQRVAYLQAPGFAVTQWDESHI